MSFLFGFQFLTDPKEKAKLMSHKVFEDLCQWQNYLPSFFTKGYEGGNNVRIEKAPGIGGGLWPMVHFSKGLSKIFYDRD